MHDWCRAFAYGLLRFIQTQHATLTLKAKIYLFHRELIEDVLPGELILDSEVTETDSSTRALLLGSGFDLSHFLLVSEGPDNSFQRIGTLLNVRRPQITFKLEWDTVVARKVILR